MATLPKTGAVTYEEWLRMPETNDREEVVNGEIRIMPPNKMPHPRIVANLTGSFHRQLDWKTTEFFATVEVLPLEDGKLRRFAILAEGLLKPKHFPAVQIDISEIWPD